MDQQIMGFAFDLGLAITVIWLAWRSLNESDLFKAITLYIVFGLMVALSWVRLKAPDVALAEAAIGAGLTGALFLFAYGHITRFPSDGEGKSTIPSPTSSNSTEV